MISICDLLTGACLKTFLLSLPPSFLLSGLRFKSRALCIGSCTLLLNYGLHVLIQNIFYEDILYIHIYISSVCFLYFAVTINTNIVLYIYHLIDYEKWDLPCIHQVLRQTKYKKKRVRADRLG